MLIVQTSLGPLMASGTVAQAAHLRIIPVEPCRYFIMFMCNYRQVNNQQRVLRPRMLLRMRFDSQVLALSAAFSVR
jgi:hypothetical protein